MTLSGALGSETFGDSSGRVVRVLGSLPGVSNVEYDGVGNPVAMVDALADLDELVNRLWKAGGRDDDPNG